MKRTILGLATILVVFLTVLAVLAVHPVRTVKAHHGCSDRTLMGNYRLTDFGEDSGIFWSGIGLAHFDGKGNFSGSKIFYVENGVPDPSNPSSVTGGAYTVNSDCTINITYIWESTTYTIHGVVVDANGSEVIAVEYNNSAPDTTGHVDIKKVADSD